MGMPRSREPSKPRLYDTSFGKILRLRRLSHQLTQKELAEAVGTSQGAISSIEVGDRMFLELRERLIAFFDGLEEGEDS